jgi:hypothetical protein
MVDMAGVVTAGAVANTEFLAWASQSYVVGGQAYRLNPTPLVEFTLEFARFVEAEVIPAAGPRVNDWHLRLIGRRLLNEHDVVLGPGLLNWGSFPSDVNPSSAIGFVEITQATGDAGKDAYELLMRLYAYFGLGPSAIPYVEDGRISEHLVQQIA